MDKRKLSCDIIKHIGTISEKKGYNKEVNLISWGGRAPVCDIRVFRIGNDGEKHPMKGISLNKADVAALKELLQMVTV